MFTLHCLAKNVQPLKWVVGDASGKLGNWQKLPQLYKKHSVQLYNKMFSFLNWRIFKFDQDLTNLNIYPINKGSLVTAIANYGLEDQTLHFIPQRLYRGGGGGRGGRGEMGGPLRAGDTTF